MMKKIRKMELVPDWSGLLPELLGEIAKRLPFFEDFTAFRGVCTTWRCAVTRKNKYQFKVPLLMLGEKRGSDLRGFYSLSKRKVCARLPFPEAMGKKQCLDAGFGWSLTVSKASSGCKLSLVKLFSCSPKIQLPKYKTKDVRFLCLSQAVLLADPSETTDFMLVLLLGDSNIACWRNRDSEWTAINQEQATWCIVNIVYYKACIYAIDLSGQIWQWDPSGIDVTIAQSIVKSTVAVCEINGPVTPLLVESTDGKLLVIWRGIRTGHYRILERVDVENGTREEIKSVGKDAIFVVDDSTTVAVAAADYPGLLRPNCIYECSEVGRIKVYSVEDGIFVFKKYGIGSSSQQQMWIFPSFS